MTIPRILPTRGTRVRGLGEVAHLALDTAEDLRAALQPATGRGIHSTAAGNAVTLSMDAPETFMCFQITGCWKRKKPKGWMGATKGLNWVCEGMPVPYWRDWRETGGSGSGSGSGSPSDDPATYWKAFKKTAQSGPTLLWWAIAAPPEKPGKKCGSGSGSGGSGDPKAKEWQNALYPLYGVGQWVMCRYDWSAGVWRVIEGYDPIIRFKLLAVLKRCKSAKANVIYFKCKAGGSGSGSGGWIGFAASGGSAGAKPCKGQKILSCVKVWDSLGVLQHDLAKGSVGWAKRCADSGKFEILFASPGETLVRFKLTAPLKRCGHAKAHTIEIKKSSGGSGFGSWGSGSGTPGGGPCKSAKDKPCKAGKQLDAITVWDLLGIVQDTLPKGTVGWASRRTDSGRYEVVSFDPPRDTQPFWGKITAAFKNGDYWKYRVVHEVKASRRTTRSTGFSTCGEVTAYNAYECHGQPPRPVENGRWVRVFPEGDKPREYWFDALPLVRYEVMTDVQVKGKKLQKKAIKTFVVPGIKGLADDREEGTLKWQDWYTGYVCAAPPPPP